MCLLSCQQKQTLLEIRYKNINWFGLCTFNPKKKKNLASKGSKMLIIISNTEQGTAEGLLLFTQTKIKVV